jgi:DNA primase
LARAVPEHPGRAEAGGQTAGTGGPGVVASRISGGQRLAALRERLLAEAGAIRTAGNWERCLRAAARLPGEGFANILLIEAQQPGATLLRGYEEWRAAGRAVNRGEPGIAVLSAARQHPGDAGRGPRRAAEPGIPGWRDASRVAYLWDVSQTSGPPAAVPSPLPGLSGEIPAELWDALCWLARREGFAVEREQGAQADGLTFWTPRRIRVLPELDAGQAAWALAHQLGHVLAHGTAPHPPGSTTSGDACAGVRRAEADAVAFITCARYGVSVPRRPGSPAAWAGTDPRAQPAAVVLAAGERVVTAASRITGHLEQVLPGAATGAVVAREPARTPALRAQPASFLIMPSPSSGARLQEILDRAGSFYCGQLAGSWAEGYLRSRGLGPGAARQWGIGYAPAGWTTLTGHLLGAGYAEEEIEAAGLARRSSRGTLIDHLRDRVVLPVRGPGGQVAGFTGRTRPGAAPGTPKYLNSPETSLYKKGDLLFGLHEARDALLSGAIPVLVEGPFDAIAVTVAGAGRLAGVAPCGTALTASQAALLARSCDLGTTGVLAAFDDDPAGRKAAARAYGMLRPFSAILRVPALGGRDPAQVFQEEGPAALHGTLTGGAVPLLGVIVDADLSRWERRLGETLGPLLALRSAAAVLAGLLPPGAADQVREAAAGAELTALDAEMRAVLSPRLPFVAGALPADTAGQAIRLAGLLGFPADEVVIEIANAVTRHAALPGQRTGSTAARVAADGFPGPPGAKTSAQAPAERPRVSATWRSQVPGRR